MTDPIADFLTRLRNASASRKETVRMPYSKLLDAVATLLMREGFLGSVERKGRVPRKTLVVTLRFIDGKPVIENLRRISKPGRRQYVSFRDLRVVKSGFGIAILSTPKGILTNLDARKQKVGGEVLCEVW